jgi:hypothetical protein
MKPMVDEAEGGFMDEKGAGENEEPHIDKPY